MEAYLQYDLMVLWCFSGFSVFVFLFQAIYTAINLSRRRNKFVISLEFFALLQLFVISHIFGMAVLLIYDGLFQMSYGLEICTLLGGGGIFLGILQWNKAEGSLLFLVASFLLLPFWDYWHPYLLIGAATLLFFRILLSYPSLRKSFTEQLTDFSIRGALDHMEEGVAFVRSDGIIILRNHAMASFMDRRLGRQYRNMQSLWNALSEKGQSVSGGTALLFKMEGGRSELFQRRELLDQGFSGWQLTVSDVTELIQVENLLEQKNSD